VSDRRFNFLRDVVGGVVFWSDDRRALHSYTAFAKLPRELPNILTLQLAITGLGRFQTHPDPGNAEFDQFEHGVFSNGIGGSKDGKLPALAGLLHALEQLQGALAVQEEIFVHDKEGMYFEFRFDAAHHVK